MNKPYLYVNVSTTTMCILYIFGFLMDSLGHDDGIRYYSTSLVA